MRKLQNTTFSYDVYLMVCVAKVDTV